MNHNYCLECNTLVANATESATGVICALCTNLKVELVNSKQLESIELLKTPKSNVPVHKRKRWTTTEDEVLYNFVQTHNISQLMEMLPGRTAYAVENRIFKLKVDHIAKQKYVDQAI